MGNIALRPELKQTAQVLADARRAGSRMATYPEASPETISDGYGIQDALIQAMNRPVAGWKAGATSETARRVMGVDEPFAGPVFDNDLLESPANLSLPATDLRIVEAEIGLRLARDLPPRPDPYSRAEAVRAIGMVHPLFEIVNKRLPGTIRETVPWAIADGALHQALIVGTGRAYDPACDLAAETVTVTVDGAGVTTGIGANTLGDPAAVLVWLINHLSERGIGIERDAIVASGLLCDVVIGEPGCTISARFSNIGRVDLTLT